MNMETKLTLKLDQSIIEQAKKYAISRKKSLSRIVEDYFKGLGFQETIDEIEINPIVKELSGIISENEISNWKDDYINHLEQKYE
jgi:hypothetical protein